MDTKQEIKDQYNKFHETYTENFSEDEFSNSLFHKSFTFEMDGKSLLDVGCGDAVDSIIFSERGCTIFGIDPSTEFLKKARLNNPEGIFKEGVGENIPFEDSTFDIVVSKWAMQTSKDVPATLNEMARVLRKGGMLVYLSKHPIIQFLQKIRDNGHSVDYYQQQIVTSNIYDGKIVLKEPSHTIGEYFNPEFFSSFEMLSYQEGSDFPASEQLNGDTYPTFFIVVARKR